jgi:phosphoglucomutase
MQSHFDESLQPKKGKEWPLMPKQENLDVLGLLESARTGVTEYLEHARGEGRIDQQSYESAMRDTLPNLESWLGIADLKTWKGHPYLAETSQNLRRGLADVISAGRWEELVNAYRQNVRFGTGGIRGMMAFDRPSIVRLKEEGIAAPILKGPNTINDIVLLRTSVGVARFGLAQQEPFEKIAIGYDSRIRGQDFAKIVAELFLAYGYQVFFFDEPGPYPEITFAIPFQRVKADVGILISASHNDYRYNGYKLSCSNGSQFDPKERNAMYNEYIEPASFADVKLCAFEDAPAGKLVFLGGDAPSSDFDYGGREGELINIHREHAAHVKGFVLTPDLADRQQRSSDRLKIAYCAFHGAGRRAVPRLLDDIGFRDVRVIHEGGLNDLDGLFPSFPSDPGREQQPDPGDPRAAERALAAYEKEYGSYDDRDILIGTDPDADRCGVVVRVPPEQQHVFDGLNRVLLPADEMWALLLWYRLQREIETSGQVRDARKRFITLSHTTSDSIVRLARKHGLGVIKTWVGFAALAAATRDVWEGKPIESLTEGRRDADAALCHPFVCEYQDMVGGERKFNEAAMEQSNGYSILGGPPPDERSLGERGHVRDKDGTLAAVLIAEVAAWARQQGTTIFQLIDEKIYQDPDVGLFVSHYEPDPIDGEYPGIEGDRKKIGILRKALECFELARQGDLEIAGLPATSAVIYRTGKYDSIYPPSEDFRFPDEGVRFYFGGKYDHLTVRPSGTGNSLRFHVQLHAPAPGDRLVEKKGELRQKVRQIADHIREIIGAPRT